MANDNSVRKTLEDAIKTLVTSISGNQLTIVGGRPESDAELFFTRLVQSSSFLNFNFESGELTLTGSNPEAVFGPLAPEVSALDVYNLYLSLRGKYPIDGIGLFRIQYLRPINKEQVLNSWNQYQRPIELATLARKIPLPTFAFSSLNKIGEKVPEPSDLFAEYRILPLLADRVCLVHGSGESADASIAFNDKRNDLFDCAESAGG